MQVSLRKFNRLCANMGTSECERKKSRKTSSELGNHNGYSPNLMVNSDQNFGVITTLKQGVHVGSLSGAIIAGGSTSGARKTVAQLWLPNIYICLYICTLHMYSTYVCSEVPRNSTNWSTLKMQATLTNSFSA